MRDFVNNPSGVTYPEHWQFISQFLLLSPHILTGVRDTIRIRNRTENHNCIIKISVLNCRQQFSCAHSTAVRDRLRLPDCFGRAPFPPGSAFAPTPAVLPHVDILTNSVALKK